MSCYKPLKGFRTPSGVVFSELRRHDILGDIEIPCGMCIGCRMRRASDWTLRCMHEASLYKQNCFVTLTYGTNCVPANGSLWHRDFQLFMKRLVKKRGPVRFYMCGEYGPLTERPHYHANLFGVDFREDRVFYGKSGSGADMYESQELNKLWTHGQCTVQDLTKETAGYCARYIMKKQLGRNSKNAYDKIDEDGVISERAPEYAQMSLKPGIGARWLEKFERDVFPHDYVIVDGKKVPPPKYYDKLWKKRSCDVRQDEVEFKREQKARSVAVDNTEERRAVREIVHEARMKSFKREL